MSSSQLTETRDRVRSFGGYNTCETTSIGGLSTQCSCKAYLRWFHRGSKMAESILVAITLLGIAAAAGFGVRELMDT